MKRAANLTAAALVTVALITDAFRLWSLEVIDAHGDDFRFYYSMARIGLNHGWSRIYDTSLQCAPIGPISEPTSHCPGLDLPPVAWAVTPFTALPYTSAYPLWVALLGLCFVAVVCLLWKLLPAPKGLYAAAAFTPYPLAYGLFLGQVTFFALLGVVLAWWLLRKGRPKLAGVALVLCIAKPQTVVLVPIALVLAGQWRTVLVFAGVSAAIGLAALASLGSQGVSDYLSLTQVAIGVENNHVYNLQGLFGHDGGTVLQYLFGLLALATAWRLRAHLEAVFLIGILGSAIFSPYWHVPDYLVLIPAAAFQLSLGPRRPAVLLAAVLFVVASPFAVGVAFLPATVQVGSWLLLIAVWLLWIATRRTGSFAPTVSGTAGAAA